MGLVAIADLAPHPPSPISPRNASPSTSPVRICFSAVRPSPGPLSAAASAHARRKSPPARAAAAPTACGSIATPVRRSHCRHILRSRPGHAGNWPASTPPPVHRARASRIRPSLGARMLHDPRAGAHRRPVGPIGWYARAQRSRRVPGRARECRVPRTRLPRFGCRPPRAGRSSRLAATSASR